MRLRRGYDYDSYFCAIYEVVEDSQAAGESGEAEIVTQVDNVKTEAGRGSLYGTTIHMKDGKIVSFTIKSYEIELKIPATIEAHDAIQKAINTLLSKRKE